MIQSEYSLLYFGASAASTQPYTESLKLSRGRICRNAVGTLAEAFFVCIKKLYSVLYIGKRWLRTAARHTRVKSSNHQNATGARHRGRCLAHQNYSLNESSMEPNAKYRDCS